MQNPLGSVEQLSPHEGPLGSHNVVRGSAKAPSGFSSDKQLSAKPWGLRLGTVFPHCPSNLQKLFLNRDNFKEGEISVQDDVMV